MVSKQRGVIAAITATLLSFLTITYISCTKTNPNLRSCAGVICENGAYCHIDTLTSKPKCTCPTGYEGVNCSVESVGKYVGTWNLQQKILSSDSSIGPNDTFSNYVVSITRSATPTTFFINNFANDPNYFHIVCVLYTAASDTFKFGTTSVMNMLYDKYSIQWGIGNISANDSVINAIVARRHQTATSNWINDIVSMTLTHH